MGDSVKITEKALKKLIYHALLNSEPFRIACGLQFGHFRSDHILLEDIFGLKGSFESGCPLTHQDGFILYDALDEFKARKLNCLSYYFSMDEISHFFEPAYLESQKVEQTSNTSRTCTLLVFPRALETATNVEDLVQAYKLRNVSSDDYSKNNWVRVPTQLVPEANFPAIQEELKSQKELIIWIGKQLELERHHRAIVDTLYDVNFEAMERKDLIKLLKKNIKKEEKRRAKQKI